MNIIQYHIMIYDKWTQAHSASTCCMQGVQVPLKRIKLHGVACPCACISWKKWGQHFEKEDTGWSIAASDWPGKIWNDYICNNDISCVPGSQEHKSKSYVYTKEGQKRGSEVWMCHSLGSAQRIARAWPGTCSLNLPLLQCYKGCISRRCTFFNGIRVFQGVAATAVIYTMLSIRFLSMHLSNHKTLGHSTYSSSSTGGRLEP